MRPHPSLRHQSHRPWPLPERSWALQQVWNDLLFLHWPVPANSLRPLIPAPLDVQEFSGTAWLAVTPFWMSGVGFANRPFPLGLSRFPELNVRTYVRFEDRPGVWFFSLDAGSRLGVLGGRWLYGLPYVYARMRRERQGDQVTYDSMRPAGVGFAARYGPAAPPEPSLPGSLEHWLTERYCLYTVRGRERLYRAEIHHRPWPLQRAAAELSRNDMAGIHGIRADGPPALLHFSRELEVIVWSLERIRPR